MNIKIKSLNPDHFKIYHKDDKILVCVQYKQKCSIGIEGDVTPGEQVIIERSSERAFARVDELFSGRAADIFKGLHITIGDNLTKSGGEAFADRNAIVFDRHKMLLSLAEAEKLLPEVLSPGDWTSVMSEEESTKSGSCLEYNIVHELGHILDGQTMDGDSYHRINRTESPTQYGRESDQFGKEKDHEAFAEGFAYVAYERPVSTRMEEAVNSTITRRLKEIDKNKAG